MAATSVLVATAPVVDDLSSDQLRIDPEFDARWAAWQTRGRIHERAVRRRLLVLAPALAAAAAIIYVILIR